VTLYGEVAGRYDEHYSDRVSQLENAWLQDWLDPLDGSILDLGCGTGLLLDIMDIDPCRYRGVDPSEEMLGVARGKHPEHSFSVDVPPWVQYDNLVCLWSVLPHSKSLASELYRARLSIRPQGHCYFGAIAPGWGASHIVPSREHSGLELEQELVFAGYQYVTVSPLTGADTRAGISQTPGDDSPPYSFYMARCLA